MFKYPAIDKDRIIAVLLFLFVFSVFISFPVQTHVKHGQDSTGFVYSAEQSRLFRFLIFPSRHLFYVPLAKSFYSIWKFFGWPYTAMLPMQFLSSLFGAAGVLVFYSVLKVVFDEDRVFSLIFSFFLAFSYAYWFFSAEALQAIPALFFRLLGVLILLKTYNSVSLKPLFYIGLVHIVGIFFDSPGIVFVPIMSILIFLLMIPKFNVKETLKRVSVYLCSIVFVLVSVYSLAYRLNFTNHSSFLSFYSFLFGKAPFHVPENSYFLFSSFSTFLISLFGRERFFESILFGYSEGFLVLFLFLLSIIFLCIARKNLSWLHRVAFIFSLLWILAWFPVIILQEPGCLEHYLYFTPAVWIAVSVALRYLYDRFCCALLIKKHIFNIVLFFILVLFSVNNFVYAILPDSKISSNEYFGQFRLLKEYSKKEDMAVVLSDAYFFSSLSLWYLNRITGTSADRFLVVDRFAGADPEYYKAIGDRIAQNDNVLLCFLFQNAGGSKHKITKISDIARKMRDKSDAGHGYELLTAVFLKRLAAEYSLYLLPGPSHDFYLFPSFLPGYKKWPQGCLLVRLRKKGVEPDFSFEGAGGYRLLDE